MRCWSRFLEAPQRPLSREQLLQATRVHEDIFDREYRRAGAAIAPQIGDPSQRAAHHSDGAGHRLCLRTARRGPVGAPHTNRNDRYITVIVMLRRNITGASCNHTVVPARDNWRGLAALAVANRAETPYDCRGSVRCIGVRIRSS